MRNEPKIKRSNSNVSWRSSGGGSSRNNEMLRFYLSPSWRTSGGGGGWEKTAARANSHGR
ncbi:unnamed protein product [Arabis nemorensis]|uniref:Uncharacterized protein n=1 Tax=Arabis nemorensis TaxID=586526 RepID=A0A565BUF0_9BRAS|nr:unnamed protein product [Arabis nemorensis]